MKLKFNADVNKSMDGYIISKRIRKIVNNHISRLEVKKLRYSKHLIDALHNLDILDTKAEKLRDFYKKLCRENQLLLRCVKEQREIEAAQKDEIEQLQQEIKSTNEKLLKLEDHNFNTKDEEKAYEKRLSLNLLNITTNTFIDGKSSHNVVRGFVGDKDSHGLHPFEFNFEESSSEECREKLWELLKLSSENQAEFDELFST